MNGTRTKLTLTALAAVVLSLALLTSCFLPGGSVNTAETPEPSEAADAPTDAATGASADNATTPPEAPTQQPTEAPTQVSAPTEKPTEAPTKAPTEAPTPTVEPTEDPAVVSAQLALKFAQEHTGTWTTSQMSYFMHFYVSNGTPYVTLGDWAMVRPTFTGKITGAEYDNYGRLLLRFDFSGTKWTSQNAEYMIFSEGEENGYPKMTITNEKEEKGFGFIKYPYFQYPVKTQTSGCTVSEFMRNIDGYWNQYGDLSGSGYLKAFLDADRVVIQIKMWDSAEVVASYTVTKITKKAGNTAYVYEIETVIDIVQEKKTVTVTIASDFSTVKTDLNMRVSGTGEPWTYYRDDPDVHKERFDFFMNQYKGTWYCAADNTYIHITYLNGKPWFQIGTWGASTPAFAGEIAAADFRVSAGAFMFGALYEYGDPLVCTIDGGNVSVYFKAGFSGSGFKEYKFDKSRQLS
ncbi:MAG: hypothetical protein J5950_01945 [Clostridia bacterium]|nr:hypothetical protein [Clostridia bacterium]